MCEGLVHVVRDYTDVERLIIAEIEHAFAVALTAFRSHSWSMQTAVFSFTTHIIKFQHYDIASFGK